MKSKIPIESKGMFDTTEFHWNTVYWATKLPTQVISHLTLSVDQKIPYQHLQQHLQQFIGRVRGWGLNYVQTRASLCPKDRSWDGKNNYIFTQVCRSKTVHEIYIHVHVHISHWTDTYTSYQMHLPTMFSLFKKNKRMFIISQRYNTFQKCNPPDFKFYLSKLINKKFPHMV